MDHSPSPPGLRIEDYDYALPPERIAQQPAEPRDAARLMVLDRRSGQVSHHVFAELDTLLRPEDVLIANRTRVVPARLLGRKHPTGGQVEALLLRQTGPGEWEALVRPGRRLAPGARVRFSRDDEAIEAEVADRLPGGHRLLRFAEDLDAERLARLGHVPLPPYIKGWVGDPERYQTVYGDRPGSAAAPTAGLHFTPQLLDRLRARGIRMEYLTLHVGPDTFRPIRGDDVRKHEMHAEWIEVPAPVITAIQEARRRGGRAVAVGTTTVRALEGAAAAGAGAAGWSGWTRLYITPGHRFQLVDAMITNFHLPRSTLLVLVSAFAGRERILAAYQEAINRGYRFYSFGDAMLLI